MKICFWGDISGALAGKTSGGSELQTSLIAKALAKAGHEVVIVDLSTKKDYVTPEGIKVFRIKGWNDGIRYIRLFTHRLPNLYKCLRDQKADVYYCRMRDFTHVFSYMAARKANGKLILAMASDLDALGFKSRLKYYYIPHAGGLWWFFNAIIVEIIYPLLRRKADLVCVQHEGQKEFLRERNIKSTLCQNLIDLDKLPCVTNPTHDYFIHVGSLDRRKGFSQFYELVKSSPLHIFKVVGQPRDKAAAKYLEELSSFKNVTICGRLSHSATIAQIANSKALISTSMMEGFPNIFIEAWACGIPVLSLNFDPGGVIEKERLGMVAYGNLEILRKALDEVTNSDEFAERSKKYVCRNHILNDDKIKELDMVFTEWNK
jgi:glycosyltransferase involved in cell wall biosynthesis